jgi:CelD/BcsL family acetyltransferase involved in cellulose biosynthesis
MSADLRCEIITDPASLPGLAADWARLAGEHPRPQVFYGPEWHAATWAAYGDERQLRTVVVRRAESVIGILPLVESSGSLVFAATPHADYCDLLCSREDAAKVLLSALQELDRKGHCTAFLQHLPFDSLLLSAVEALPGAWRGRLRLEPGDMCPGLRRPDAAALESLIKKKSLKRHERLLARNGELSFVRVTARAEITALLDEFFRQHSLRRALAGGRSLFRDERPREFYRALIAELDPAAELHFTVLRCGERVAGFHLGFLLDGRLIWYKPSFDVDLWEAGPGEVLIKRLLETVRDQGMSELDFSRGDEAFKRRFANEMHRNTHLRMLPPGMSGRLQATRRALAAWLRSVPLLKRCYVSLSSAMNRLSRACKKHGFVRTLRLQFGELWRRFVYVRGEVVVYVRPAEHQIPQDVQKPDLRMERASLSQLVEAVLEYPDFYDARRLRMARERVRRGDEPALAWKGDQLAHVVWMSTRTELIASSEIGTEVSCPFGGEATLLYDGWTPDAMRGQRVYPWVLAAIVPQQEGDDLYGFCLTENVPSMRGLERAGYKLMYRMGRIRWFGIFRRHWGERAESLPN